MNWMDWFLDFIEGIILGSMIGLDCWHLREFLVDCFRSAPVTTLFQAMNCTRNLSLECFDPERPSFYHILTLLNFDSPAKECFLCWCMLGLLMLLELLEARNLNWKMIALQVCKLIQLLLMKESPAIKDVWFPIPTFLNLPVAVPISSSLNLNLDWKKIDVQCNLMPHFHRTFWWFALGW